MSAHRFPAPKGSLAAAAADIATAQAEAAFARRSAEFERFFNRGPVDADWSIIDAAEAEILAATGDNHRLAELKLWLALSYCVPEGEHELQITRGDFASINEADVLSRFGQPEAHLIVSAIAALKGGQTMAPVCTGAMCVTRALLEETVQ